MLRIDGIVFRSLVQDFSLWFAENQILCKQPILGNSRTLKT